jgi:hypothetical protein
MPSSDYNLVITTLRFYDSLLKKTDFSSFGLVCCLIIVMLCFGTIEVSAQNFVSNSRNSVIRVNVTASVQSAIDVETLSDINLGRISTTNEMELYINPRSDNGAGIMRLRGQPNSLVSVSFIESRELFHLGGGQPLLFFFEISGAQENDQLISEPLTVENRQISLSGSGEYYFWIGGRMSLEGISFGAYEGEFTFEIDYI